jgi:4-amino-4-deoxy-L-arabinose transferase-like glycosyltransferase
MPRVALVVLAAATLLLYAARLGDAPIYLSPDEATIAIDAHALATTGRDVEGRWLPLYFHVRIPGDWREGWFTPAIFYVSALFLQVLPLSEFAVRLPTACVGAADVVLMFLVARVLFERQRPAWAAAAMLAQTPAHFILSRYALDYLYPVPFILGWLLGLAHYARSGRLRPLVLGVLCLGAGFFSYIASVVMMPIYLALTGLVIYRRAGGRAAYGAAVAAFALPLVPLAPWLLAHPSAVRDTMQRYALEDPQGHGTYGAIRTFLSFGHLDELASRYWSFFNPSFLFFSGDAQTMFSTHRAGVFLLPMAVLIVAGIYAVIRARRTPLDAVIALGFVTAPVAALLVPEASAINRAVELFPFAVLLGAIGLEAMLQWRQPAAPAVAGLLVLALALQFAMFARDYFTDYRQRSAAWLGGNLRGALEELMTRADRDRAPAVYFATLRATSGQLDIRNRWMDSYWKFYLLKNRQSDLLQRTRSFDAQAIAAVPEGSLVLGNLGDVTADGLVRTGALRTVASIPEADASHYFVVLQK